MITKQTLLTTLSRFLSNCDKRYNKGSGGNAPLIVMGVYDDSASVDYPAFTPNEGQPSWNAARIAFKSGTPVLLQFTSDGVEVTAQVTSVAFDGAGDKVIFAHFAESTGGYSQLYWCL